MFMKHIEGIWHLLKKNRLYSKRIGKFFFPILKILFFLIEIPLVIGFTYSFFLVLKIYTDVTAEKMFFLVGIFAFIAIRLLIEGFTKHSFRFIDNFEHEVTHIVFSWAFLKRVKKLVVTGKVGGSVEVEGDNLITRLSPYFFPLTSFVLLIPYPFLQIGYRKFDLFLVGVAYGIHIISTIKDIHIDQPDLKRGGFVFSMMFVILMNLIFAGILFSIPVGSQHIGDFLITGVVSILGMF